MINEVYYSGAGPAVYAGGMHDIVNQIGSAASLGGIAGHPGGRVGRRAKGRGPRRHRDGGCTQR